MKLIIAVINNDDSSRVSSNLAKNGYFSTKLATTGGFLMAGNTTLLLGVEEDRVDGAIEIIKKFSKRRTQQTISHNMTPDQHLFPALPAEVVIGGATIFVIDIDHFEKV